MFSGIVETTSDILQVEDGTGQRSVVIRKPRGWKLLAGESVSVDGTCSTIESVDGGSFQVVYMPETLRKTTLGEIKRHGWVNLERSLTLGSLVGGHLVQGHVDTTARITSVHPDGTARIYGFALPARFSAYIVEKGSVAVDGISLTVVKTRRGGFEVSALAYTLSHTTLGEKGRGRRVNIELDIIAKYVEKLAIR